MITKALPMKILCITHADFETPGAITDWVHKNNHDFIICKPYAGENCLTYDNFDLLIIMGGPQSASDYHHTSYLHDEITLIQNAIAQNKIILGFCLGAQLIGEALGATTEKSPHKECGIYPIFLTSEAANDPLLNNMPTTFDAIHWHNDMPGLTKNAHVLAYSAGCPRQIIRYNEKIYGFQCHLEMTKETMATLIDACPEDLKPTTFTQTPNEIMRQDYQTINKNLFHMLNTLSGLQKNELRTSK